MTKWSNVKLKEYREAVAAGCSAAMNHYRNRKLRPWCHKVGVDFFCLTKMLAVHSKLAECAAHLDTVDQRNRFVPVAAALPHLLHAVMLLEATGTAVGL